MLKPNLSDHYKNSKHTKTRSQTNEQIKQNSQESNFVVQDYEKIIRLQKEDSLNVVLRQGKIFKRFKDSERFGDKFKKLGVSRFTVYFKLKLNLLKLSEKYPKLKKSSSTLNFLNNYFKSIKEASKESETEFKQVKFCNLGFG